MGNQHSFQQHIDFKDLNTNYTYEKKYSDSRFGEVKLLRENSTGQQIFQKDFSTNTPKEFEQYVSSISDSTVLAHPNILRIFGYNSKKEDMFCADFYKLSLFFESFESDLEQEITTRQHTKNYFQETELWNLLDSISSACAYLQNNNIPHRDIRPFNILINAKKDYKITTTNIFGQSYNPGYFGHFDGLEARSRYYSPELLHHFSLPENKRTPFDEYKNDVFALGMTLLEAGLLEKVDNAYNFDKHEVKQAPIKDALNRLGERYSASFVKTVESALNFDPVARLDFVRLDHELGVYRRDIRGQAKGVASSPVRTAPALSVHPEAPVYQSDELDNRVREAVRKSEAVIRRSSPSKYANKNLDPYIQAYLRNDLKPTEEPLLNHISQYLTSESKYTTTLTIEQPNYGRESQPINFSQTQPREDLGESFKRSAVDLAQTIPGGYQPQPVTNYGQTPSHYEPVQRTQPEQQHYLTQSGISPNYGGAHVDNYRYGATSAAGTPQQNYVQESDDLTRRIEERLKQSRQISH